MPIRTINKSSVHDFTGMAFAMVHDHCRQRYCPLGLSAIGTYRKSAQQLRWRGLPCSPHADTPITAGPGPTRAKILS